MKKTLNVEPTKLALTKLSILVLALFSSAVQAQTNLLSGVFSMPQGVVPVSQSVVYRIATVPLDTYEVDGQTLTSSTEVTIPVLNSFANYSIDLPDFSADSPGQTIARKLEFECISGCQNIAITTVGYWGAGLGVVSKKDAADFNAAQSQSINLTMQRADFFAGTISLPDELTASGSEVFTITMKASDFFDPASFSQQVNTQEGGTRWNFSIGVPSASTLGSWLMSLSCASCDESIPVGPYYPSTQSGVPLVTESSGQFFYRKNRGYSNIRLTLPAPPESPKTNIAPITTLLLDE